MKTVKSSDIQAPRETAPAGKTVKILEAVGDEEQIEADLEKERDDAFRATPFFWQGKELHPFAVDREADWLAFRASINAPELGKVAGGGITFLADAIRILFFCSSKPSLWMPLMGYPDTLDEAIRSWAKENVPQGTQYEAVALALSIYNRAHATQSVPAPSKKVSQKKSQPRQARPTT